MLFALMDQQKRNYFYCDKFSGAVPCTLLILGLVFIPESPRWLVGIQFKNFLSLQAKRCKTRSFIQAKIEHDDFKAALQALRGRKSNIAAEVQLIQVDDIFWEFICLMVL